MTGVRDVRAGFTEYANWARDPRPRIGWGLPFFDNETNGGIARSEVCMVMAASSVGKTALALNVIRNNPDMPVLFFSLEMSWRMVVQRLAAMVNGVSTKSIEAKIKLEETPLEVANTIARYPGLVCDDTPAITLKEAAESFRRATDLLGAAPRLVVWDYLELIGGSGMLGKAEQVDRASQKLRDWHRQHDCAGLILHQVGKGDSSGDEALDLMSGRYGGHTPMDYVVGAYAPRLKRGITSDEFKAVRDDMFLQLLKNRAGQARPSGVRHRLDHVTMRLDEWTRPQFSYGFQSPLPDVDPDVDYDPSGDLF